MFVDKKMAPKFTVVNILVSLFFLSFKMAISGTLLHMEHLKQPVCHLCPPANFSSAAYTDLLHFGHLGISIGLKGIFFDFGVASPGFNCSLLYPFPSLPAPSELAYKHPIFRDESNVLSLAALRLRVLSRMG